MNIGLKIAALPWDARIQPPFVPAGKAWVRVLLWMDGEWTSAVTHRGSGHWVHSGRDASFADYPWWLPMPPPPVGMELK